ncbi:hypothetical protein DL240_00385 [Lujinxingia litoralis]|uniref:Outer membrane protein beta-barrel domain-containing protein n=2 Tax=Lujinxingia litoralis TaxID=2211119 RepID=A0A328CC30_9DELT|nr:hypothetical protein DL240_00385 [Lujinxingia litoralis]
MRLSRATGLAILSLFLLVSAAGAEERPSIEERVVLKEDRLYGHLSAAMLVRNDFYDTPGFGLDLGYYFDERWGAELRVLKLQSTLSRAGASVLEQTGLAPDLRAPDLWLSAGVRSSLGYAKILVWERFVMRFDPQLVGHAGVLFAEERIAPGAAIGAGVVIHMKWDLQLKIDLLFSAQFENRLRGIAPAFGFMPSLSLGWSLPLGGNL